MAQVQPSSSPSLADHPVPQQSIAFLAQNNAPITLPWSPSNKPLAPGTLFNSRLCERADPWGKTFPWDPDSIKSAELIYRLDDGGHASFQSIETNNSTNSEEHLGVSFGISAGCSFLNASVTGGYDRDLMENKDGLPLLERTKKEKEKKNNNAKANLAVVGNPRFWAPPPERKFSIRTSYRAGSITLRSRPALSDDALVVLKHQGGISAFKYQYGDYYVAGYRLGGDAGVALSETATANRKAERLSVKVSVKVLFVKASKTHEKFLRSAGASSGFRVSGFDTLTQTLVPAGSPVSVFSESKTVDKVGGVESAMEQLATRAKDMEKLCIGLPRRVTHEINKLGLRENQIMTWQGLQEYIDVEQGMGSHLVVEMILLPITSLRPVIEWSMSADVIGC
ncbi:hypothetical protein MKX08_001507 [Trichoderma sp. CBMAI-0020]|nr:hypothetical protein MKX08_001507 [Trichoderma sp. CBMAI-0020]